MTTNLCEIVSTKRKPCSAPAARQLRGEWLCAIHYDTVVRDLQRRGLKLGEGDKLVPLQSRDSNDPVIESSDDLSVDLADGRELYLHECDGYLKNWPHATTDIVFYIDDASQVQVLLLCDSCVALYRTNLQQDQAEAFDEGQEQ
jgi:hypothetical protein